MTIYNMANGDCANYEWNESEGELKYFLLSFQSNI